MSQVKPREFWMHTLTLDQALNRCDLGESKNAIVCAYPHKDDLPILTRVIEKSAYDKAVEALKWIKESWCIEGCGCKSCETLRELGVEGE